MQGPGGRGVKYSRGWGGQEISRGAALYGAASSPPWSGPGLLLHAASEFSLLSAVPGHPLHTHCPDICENTACKPSLSLPAPADRDDKIIHPPPLPIPTAPLLPSCLPYHIAHRTSHIASIVAIEPALSLHCHRLVLTIPSCPPPNPPPPPFSPTPVNTTPFRNRLPP